MKDFKTVHEPLLSERTSIALGGRAIAELIIESHEDQPALSDFPLRAEALLERLKSLGGEIRCLGRGTNILARDNASSLLPITLIRLDLGHKISLLPEPLEKDGVNLRLVRVPASCAMPVLLAKLAEFGLSGLEGLAGIPGNVGGAVAMNAGSYGCDIASVLYEVDIFSPSLGVLRLGTQDFNCSYRKFMPLGLPAGEWFMVTEAVFALRPAPCAKIKEIMRDNISRKKITQPVSARSAGCVFKNPAQGLSAGKLLDEAGIKGKQKGGMAFSELHANFLVNNGGGTSEQAFELIEEAKEAVLKRHGVALELEVKVWP